MARVARSVAARLAQQADKKRLEGYAENLERQASDILKSAGRQTSCGPSHEDPVWLERASQTPPQRQAG